MSDKTVTIIGAGLGGLVTGALLAKNGYRVTVVEKNRHVGGGLQSYKRFGVTFDTGMHIFGGMNPDGNIFKLCRYLNIVNKFNVLDLDQRKNIEVFVRNDNASYDLCFNSDMFVESFSRYFPEQRHNLQRYHHAVRQIMERFDLFYLRPASPKVYDHKSELMLAADDFINKYITDHRLASLLAVVNTLYAGESHISPAFLHAAITMIFLNGACRVAGGYSTFADALVEVIKNNGGNVIVGDQVETINTKDHKADGVVTKSGRSLSSDYLVSSIPLTATISMMDDDKLLSNAYKAAVESKMPSLSAFIVNIKLKRDTLKFSNHIGFYLDDYDSVWTAYDGTAIKKLMYMTPPVVDQGEFAETLNVILPMRWDVVARWENTRVGLRGTEYRQFKDCLLNEIIDKLTFVIPQIRDIIEDVDTASPLTIRDYTGVINGAMCGDRKDCKDPLSIMPVVTRVPNLFVTGQNVNMHGFCGVTLTAIQTAEAILGKNYIINRINAQS